MYLLVGVFAKVSIYCTTYGHVGLYGQVSVWICGVHFVFCAYQSIEGGAPRGEHGGAFRVNVGMACS